MAFKEARKQLKIGNAELLGFLEKKSSIIYYIENNYKKKSIIKYIIFLRMKGADLNDIFDKLINSDYKKIK